MTVRFGPFTLDPAGRRLLRARQPVHLTPKAFELIHLLVTEAPRVVSKRELHERLWPGSFVSDATLVGLVKEVRRALDDRDPKAPVIRTAHRVGYALCLDVEEVSAAPAPRVWHWLVLQGRRVVLRQSENIVGRDPASQVFLDAAGVSRRHARIVIDERGVQLEDLGSKNGTTLNDAAVEGVVVLHDGDRIDSGRLSDIERRHVNRNAQPRGAWINQRRPPLTPAPALPTMGRVRMLQPGARIGHYEILTAIGKGGMGEVWKARDTRLRRDVAIKALPDAVAQDPERLARLEHEAALLASLNHPHIATIHGLERDGTSYLVLELVEGNTLEDRLLLEILPVEEALMLALQLAQALEAAHDKDIIHRDLKPSNIKVTPEKRLKVLDFGIAKALAAPSGNETRTVKPTETGVIVGTPAYMSPEQARGEAVGGQSDIWSFGAVLYEMLTGVSPFKRKTSADTLASVLESQPDYAALPPATPVAARRLIQRCLEKDPSRRLRHMQDVRILVEDALVSLGSEAPSVSAPAARRRRWWVAGGVAVAALAGAVVGLLAHRSAPENPLVYASVPFSGNPVRWPFGLHHLAISRQGSTVAFASSAGLQIRRLDQKNSVTIPTGTGSVNNPFFSPDGDWVGAFSDTALVKVPVSGGPPITLTARTDRPTGGTWRTDGTIVFATSDGLFEVSANGGERKVIARPDRSRKETLYAWPQFLPDGRSLLFTVVSEDANEPLQTVRLDLTSRERRTVLRGSSAVYVPGGYLIYAAGATLSAVAFDGTTITGKPVSFPEIEVAVAADNGAADFAISDTGTLIFAPPATSSLRTLEWIDRRGTHETLAVEPQTYGYARVSPDGTRVAVERTTSGNRDIWILDLNRLQQTQLTDSPGEDMLPVWSTDGRRVFFASNRAGTFDVYSQAADGASSAKLEFGGPEIQVPNAPTPDGSRLLVYDRFNDLAVLDLAKPDHLEPLLHSEFDERLGEVSPDGKWIAYESDESGNQFEIILRSFPNVNERREIVSVNGGRFPRWGPKGGHELYYVAPNGAMMAVSITLSPKLALGRPVKLFDWQKPPGARSGHLYDVAPDGRFLVVRSLAPNPDSQTNVSLILNWAAMLQNRRP